MFLNNQQSSVPPLRYQVLQPTKAMKMPLPSRMFKGIANSIAPSLSKLFNISFRLGCFPSSWKTSSVVPILKIHISRRPQIYRPISLLPIMSELLQQHIHPYITISPSETNTLSNRQWGFQGGRLTVTALLTDILMSGLKC